MAQFGNIPQPLSAGMLTSVTVTNALPPTPGSDADDDDTIPVV